MEDRFTGMDEDRKGFELSSLASNKVLEGSDQERRCRKKIQVTVVYHDAIVKMFVYSTLEITG